MPLRTAILICILLLIPLLDSGAIVAALVRKEKYFIQTVETVNSYLLLLFLSLSSNNSCCSGPDLQVSGCFGFAQPGFPVMLLFKLEDFGYTSTILVLHCTYGHVWCSTCMSRSYGQYLGLTNTTTDGMSSNHLIVVEIDTIKQDEYDPNDNYMGLDLNSTDHAPVKKDWFYRSCFGKEGL